MKVIWKWPLELTVHQRLNVPVGIKFLAVQMQGDKITLWGEFPLGPDDGSGRERPIDIVIAGTGHPFPDSQDMKYIGTVQMDAHVWHVYET